jgi:hypothetical protein
MIAKSAARYIGFVCEFLDLTHMTHCMILESGH